MIRSTKFWAIFLLAVIAISLGRLQLLAGTMKPPEKPPQRVHHVVIISIDGGRPDVLLRANTPNLHNLMAQGSFTFYAETTDVAVTLPSHTSMLTGVTPDRHGIDFNTDPPDGVFPKFPTIFNLAHDAGMTTGVFSTKSKFTLFTPPGIVDYIKISPDSSALDGEIADAAVAAIRDHKPGAMLVHFGNNDGVGHSVGWGTPEQIATMELADDAVGKVVNALRSAAIFDDTLLIISADHGGSGTTHGADDPRSRYIPWIAVGPQIRKNYDLTRDRQRTIHTEDTFATACYFLGILPSPAIDGKPVMEIIAQRELLSDK